MELKVAVMQPYFMPYIGYFQLINAVDKFVLLDDVNYIKKGWINRNNILLDDKKHLFTIPLKKVSQNKKINETYLVDDENWKENFLKTIQQSYVKAPYFKEIKLLLENILKSDSKTISELNFKSISSICDYLSINTEIINNSVQNNSNATGESRIIEIVQREKGGIYINAVGGKELYNHNNFERKNITLKFIENQILPYKQFKNEFIGGLSIIDLLMFNSKEQMKTHLESYTLT